MCYSRDIRKRSDRKAGNATVVYRAPTQQKNNDDVAIHLDTKFHSQTNLPISSESNVKNGTLLTSATLEASNKGLFVLPFVYVCMMQEGCMKNIISVC